MSKKSNRTISALIFILILAALAYFVYKLFFSDAVHFKDKNYTYLYIKHTDTFEDVLNSVDSEKLVNNLKAFEWLAKKMELDKNIHPGRYRVTNGMNTRQIINLLKYNKQEKVRLTFNSQIHNLEEFINYVDEKLEIDSDELENYLNDESKLNENFSLDPETAFGLIVPDVFDVSWAIETDELFSKIKDEYDIIWNNNRIKQAKKIGFSISEVITIASITQCESNIESEQRKIAGVYINRLRKGMLLQADPTLKFANGNFDARRILNIDKEISSPYNTYKYKGLPPGPICLVSTNAIDAVLNYSKHDFIFFCAKPQLNGFSDFSSSYEQHRKYAIAYQKAMNQKGINR